VSLVRPLNGAIAAAAVFVGAFVAARPTAWGPAALGAAAAFFATSGANALNDVSDLATDRVNRPERPVAAGRIRPQRAREIGLGGYAAALACAVVLSRPGGPGIQAFTLVAAWVALTILYSSAAKGAPVAGNVVVAAVAASPLLMGGITQRNVGATFLPFWLAFLIHLTREIVKDGEDVEGDRATDVRTLAVAAGPAASLAAARLVAIVAMALAIVPYALGNFGPGYLAVVVLLEGILGWRFVLSRPEPSRETFRALSRALKIVMVLGLVAFVAGVF
jgi:geranylgeranylglycerol-phosphate geranylgeranyltransferase